MRACMHTNIDAYIEACKTYRHIQTCIHLHVRAHVPVYAHIHMFTYIYIYIVDVYIDVTHIQACVYTSTDTLSCINNKQKSAPHWFR